MKKKLLTVILILLGVAVFVFLLYKNGVITFDTYSANNQTPPETNNIEELKNGSFYIWHNEKYNDFTKALENADSQNIYKLCPTGDVNWDEDTFINHTLWFTSENDIAIPTLYPGDKLLYISVDSVPYKGISWERFSDYGYTIGVANLEKDSSDHYRIISEDGKDFQGYIYDNSDAAELVQFAPLTNLFLDKVGGAPIREQSISSGGTVLNLNKDHEYVCEWYTGTYYQDFRMKANIHTFSFLESFTTYKYEFLHNNVVEIVIPDWFKTGYYYVDKVGFFRYLAEPYASVYNGQAYDADIYWNDPIILYDEYGNLIYNPATGVDKTNENGSQPGTGTGIPQHKGYQEDQTYDQNKETDGYDSYAMQPPELQEEGDAGVEFYETNEDVEDPNHKF